ncbi:hypothetical protein CONLIGDRAFT_637572 [Coniochaeta ligniaria NRRL 30616]|uniref:Uncharacterized protein n=1 Tax=Coniochaeta ligniaria NRRL 30616 TaxID=1408157 RepID=A0A1J7I8A3_9PEZI|nr:hypothetical protein CONLIGDRAFT_637572 [Coniochaeta ligniaria NRRL 30616]
MEDVDDDQSDDDEGSNSDEDKADWDAEYSSADDVLDHDDPDTAVWAPIQEPMVPPVFLMGDHALNGAPCDARYDDDMPVDAHKARLDHPFGFAGPYPVPYFPVSENAPVFAPARVTLPSLLNQEARPASPSDAALPKRSVNLPSVLPLGGSSTAEALGEKTGKYEYFAAREENRLRTFAPSRQRPASPMNDGWVRYTDYSKPAMSEANPIVAEESSVAEETTVAEKHTAVETRVAPENSNTAQKQHFEDWKPAEKQLAVEMPKAVEKAVEEPSIAEKPSVDENAAVQQSQPPAKLPPVVIPKSFAANQTVVITPLLQTGDNFLNRPQSSADFRLPTYPGDDTDEPISAYELQKRKLAAQKHQLLKENDPKVTDGTRRTHVGISDIVDVSPAPAPEPARQAPVTGGGKRKADDMLELSDKEIQWEASESTLMRHMLAAEEAMLRSAPMGNGGLRLTPLPQPQARTVSISKHVEPLSDVRPPKRLRLRKIAERLGYAALGGATVGAALVSTLIYTAPTFT